MRRDWGSWRNWGERLAIVGLLVGLLVVLVVAIVLGITQHNRLKEHRAYMCGRVWEAGKAFDHESTSDDAIALCVNSGWWGDKPERGM